jgi:Tol biopolymer transport system component
LGIWRGRSATAPANYLQRGWQAADVGFVRLDADPITGATIDELTPGVPLQFNTTTPQHGWDLYGYPLGENSQIRVNICPGIHLVHVVPVTSVAGADAGPGDDWTVPCSGMIGGASGGPWINVQTHRIEAINSKEQDGVVVGALLGDAAESAYRAQAFVQWPGTTTPAGGATADTLGNASSGGSHISADGRFITYRSNATNLVSGDTNDTDDVFVFDTQTLRTSRVSVANGDVQGDGMSDWPTISADGRYVAFRSAASNLVPGDTNGADDTFVRDLVAGTTTRVSVGTAEAQGNSSVRGGPTISADGHYVAFFSYASNLVPGDTNGMSDVFVRDRQTGRTSRVSVSSAGAQANPYDHIEDDARPSISADGRYVAFVSGAANLTPGDTNGTDDVFVRDRQTGRTTRASVSSAGAQTRAWSDWPSISGDGRYVAFVSAAADLVPGDVNRTDDIFVRDLHAGSTTRVSVSSAEVQSRGASSNPDISSDGRYVVFQSAGTNLVPADTNSRDDVFLRDRQAGTTSRISVTTTNGQVNGASSYPSIAPSGRYVVFSSLGTNLGPWDTNDTWDVFVRRLRA